MLRRTEMAATNMKAVLACVLLMGLLLGLTPPVGAKGVFNGQTARPLRYYPEGTDFGIENGVEFFNRPLYGTNTAFRVDAGDRPEFVLYLPGRGGNLRLGIKTAAGQKWLFDAEKVVTRYRPGSMLYEIRDPLLGGATLHLSALAMSATEGLVLRAELRGASVPVELIWAYGGANGERGRPAGLLPGSNRIAVDLGGGSTVEGVVVNWKLKANDAMAKWDAVNLTPFFNDRVTRIFKNEYLSPRSPYVSLAIPKQGIGSWVHWNETFEVDDTGLRAAAKRNCGRFFLPSGIQFETPGSVDAKNVVFTSQWDNYPREVTVPLSGRAARVYLLMAGSSNQMQSRFDNGEVVVTYQDGSVERLALHNPTNWWPIDQDYFIDDYAFRRPEPIPPRVDLQSGAVRVLEAATFKGTGGKIAGGAGVVLDLPLDGDRELKSLTVRTLANEVIIGLLGVTLKRD